MRRQCAIRRIMPNIDDEIRARTASFANDITVLVRRLALESVATALGQPRAPAPVKAAAPARPVRSAPAPRARAATPAKAAPKAAPAPKAPVSKRPAAPAKRLGEKRPPAELAKLTEKLYDYIKANPGRRMEAITKGLNTP